MKLYDETKPLYLETDAPGWGLGVDLLQISHEMHCLWDEAPDNTIQRLIALSSKNLSSTERRYSNIWEMH